MVKIEMFVLQVITGGVVSTTVTLKVQVPVAPALSVAVQVTLLDPRRKLLPEGGTQVTGNAPPEESAAVG
jgi:hypothetical protein